MCHSCKQPQQKSGPNHVPAYQLSGIPFVTSSINTTEVPSDAGGASVAYPIQVDFPYVTKNIKIRNTGLNELKVAFSYSGSFDPGQTLGPGTTKPNLPNNARNYFLIPTGSGNQGHPSVQDFDVRCKSVFLLGDGGTTGFSLFAGLTTIPAGEFPVLTGSVDGARAFHGVG